MSSSLEEEFKEIVSPSVPPIATRGYDPARVQPVRWLWRGWIPIGKATSLVGSGEAGKGTFTADRAAAVTRGTLDGDLFGEPRKVLIVGDEDGFDDTWIPRMAAAGADIELVRTLDDGVEIDDIHEARASVTATLKDGYGLVVWDQLLDNIDGGKDGTGIYNPKQIRNVMRTIRRIAADAGVASLATLHPTKGKHNNFRDLVGGSAQFTDGVRSALYLCLDADDTTMTRRVLTRAKGNLSAAPISQSFRIVEATVEVEDRDFKVPRAVDWCDDGRSVADLMAGAAAPQATNNSDRDEVEI